MRSLLAFLGALTLALPATAACTAADRLVDEYGIGFSGFKKALPKVARPIERGHAGRRPGGDSPAKQAGRSTRWILALGRDQQAKTACLDTPQGRLRLRRRMVWASQAELARSRRLQGRALKSPSRARSRSNCAYVARTSRASDYGTSLPNCATPRCQTDKVGHCPTPATGSQNPFPAPP